MAIQIIDPGLIAQIAEIAKNRQQTPEQVIAEAVQFYATQTKKTAAVDFLRSIAGQGASGQTDVSERDEEILASEIDPVRGWQVKDEGADAP